METSREGDKGMASASDFACEYYHNPALLNRRPTSEARPFKSNCDRALLFAQDPFGRPLNTLPDHALCGSDLLLSYRRGPAIGGAEAVPDVDRGDCRGEIDQLLVGKFLACFRMDLITDTIGEQGQRFRPGERRALTGGK